MSLRVKLDLVQFLPMYLLMGPIVDRVELMADKCTYMASSNLPFPVKGARSIQRVRLGTTPYSLFRMLRNK